MLRRLCVFAGRFTIEDVESVCTSADASDALELLSSLVDKSLVMREDARSLACYRLHETMREFARLKLDESGEAEAFELRCAEYYLSRCQRAALENRFRLVEWLEWAELEIDNIRAVLRRYLRRADFAAGTELTACLGWYWITRATTEGIRWLDEFLVAEDGTARGWAYFIRGFLAVLKADPAAARPALSMATAIAQETDQRELLSEALAMAANAANMAGDRAAARRLLDEAEVTVTDLAYPPGQLALLQARSIDGFYEADPDAVRSAARPGERLARETGDLYPLEIMLLNLGSAALMAGDLDQAQPLLAEALRIAQQIDDRVAQFYLLDAIGCHAGLRGQPRLAARLLGAAQDAQTGVGANKMPFLAPSLTQARERASAALGVTRYQAEFEAGRRLGRDAALGLALGQGRPEATVPAAGRLAKREADVARLVADGLTNKQVGARLFISERTVDSHVRSILNKLGVGSRAQIAAWVATLNQ